jgi:hypothetical protein
MIQRIIFTKLRAGQLDNSGITVSDLRTLVVRMSDTLVNMFHHRIRYPWQDERRMVTHFTTPLPGSVSSLAIPPARPSPSSPERPASETPSISVGQISLLPGSAFPPAEPEAGPPKKG